MPKRNARKYNNDWPIVAICYDFDRTLSPKEMQNFDLIPSLNCSVEEFWKESNAIAKENGMDKILTYMKLIIDKAKANKVRVTEGDFKRLGKKIQLFPGVEGWFERVNGVAQSLQVNVEHYIISAGLKEIIEGTSIAKYFAEIYASSFIYDEFGAPVWPRQVVNYTTKTQHLFRISKNCLDLSDENSVNMYIRDDLRRIPFCNFIYIGDSETDIPAMKIIKNGGGTSIGVYNFDTANISRVAKLLTQERIDYLVPAIYEEGSRLDVLVRDTLKKIKAQDVLNKQHNVQSAYADNVLSLDNLVECVDTLLKACHTREDVRDLEKQINSALKQYEKRIRNEFISSIPAEEIDKIVEEKKEAVKALIAKKKKSLAAAIASSSQES